MQAWTPRSRPAGPLDYESRGAYDSSRKPWTLCNYQRSIGPLSRTSVLKNILLMRPSRTTARSIALSLGTTCLLGAAALAVARAGPPYRNPDLSRQTQDVDVGTTVDRRCRQEIERVLRNAKSSPVLASERYGIDTSTVPRIPWLAEASGVVVHPVPKLPLPSTDVPTRITDTRANGTPDPRVRIDPLKSATWFAVPDGWIAVLAIEALPSTTQLSVHINLAFPHGSFLAIYAPCAPAAATRYYSNEHFPMTGIWTLPVPGREAILEFFDPSDVSPKNRKAAPFIVTGISRGTH